MPEGAPQSPSELSAEERRSFDRLVNFTDAVVAIGITLQLLPLIDVEGPKPGQTVWDVLSANSGQITAFALSFVVVIAMWATHNRIFNVMRRYDGTIFVLNVIWLAGIVFLPWPTSMYGQAVNDEVVGAGGVGLFYWWTLATISGVGSFIALHAWRHPELLEPGALQRHGKRRSANRIAGAVFFSAFLAIGVASEFVPAIAPYFAFALFPISSLVKRWGARKDATRMESP